MLYCANFKGGQGDDGEHEQSRRSAPEGTAEVPAGEDRRRAAGRETRRTAARAAETIANAAKDAGATLVGDVLKLDDTNEADQTDGKIAAWVDTLKAAL